jgi:hypothetical protein
MMVKWSKIYIRIPLLAPLRRRADTLVSPAREQLERLERGEPIERIAEDFATWKEVPDV